MSNLNSIHNKSESFVFPSETPSGWFQSAEVSPEEWPLDRLERQLKLKRDLNVIFKKFSSGPEELKLLKTEQRGTKRAFDVLLKHRPDLVNSQALHGLAEYISGHPQALDSNSKNPLSLARALHVASNDPLLFARADQFLAEVQKDAILNVRLHQLFNRTQADSLTFYALVHLSWLWEGARRYLETQGNQP